MSIKAPQDSQDDSRLAAQLDVAEQINSRLLEEDICIHIFNASAGFVGVCLTLIGLFHSFNRFSKVAPLLNHLLVGSAVIFLLACVSSYVALRTRKRKRRYRLERTADSLFLFGLVLIVILGALIAYEFI